MKKKEYSLVESKIPVSPINQRIFTSIPIDDPILPETFTDALPPDNDLVNSIITHGMVQPIIIAEYSDGTRKLKAGRRRVWASREAFKLLMEFDKADIAGRVKHMPAMVYPDADHISAAFWTLLDNYQRSDNPLAELDAIREIIRENHLQSNGGYQALAHAIGADKNYVKRLLNTWGKMPEPIIESIRDGRTAIGVATSITKLKEEQQRELVRSLEKNKTITGADVKAVKRVQQDAAVAQMNAATVSTDWDSVIRQSDPYTKFAETLKGMLEFDDDQLRHVIQEVLKKVETRTL